MGGLKVKGKREKQASSKNKTFFLPIANSRRDFLRQHNGPLLATCTQSREDSFQPATDTDTQESISIFIPSPPLFLHEKTLYCMCSRNHCGEGEEGGGGGGSNILSPLSQCWRKSQIGNWERGREGRKKVRWRRRTKRKTGEPG